MRYLVYRKNQIKEEQIYCNKGGNETSEDIAKAIVSEIYIGKFNANEHQVISEASTVIKNDTDMFILKDMDGYNNIWQICGKVADYSGTIIPNLYKIRKVGIMFI